MATIFVILLLVSIIGLVAGLVNPKLFKEVLKKNTNRKTVGKVFGLAILICFIMIGLTAPKTDAKPAVLPVETPKTETKASAETASKPQLLNVLKVVDGDTIDVETIGRIRLIGMDTPETVDPRTVVQCFGQEATNKANELLAGKKVTLETDPVSGDKDTYGRSLRYVFLEDGTNFDKFMISEGYAHEYTYNSIPYKYQVDFKAAEVQARNAGKGLWAASSCNGDTTKAVATPAPVVTQSTNNTNNSAPANNTQNVSVSATTQSNIAPAPFSAPVQNTSGGVVKKSSTGICHAPGTTYYIQTKSFTSFDTIEACLASGGRLPKR